MKRFFFHIRAEELTQIKTLYLVIGLSARNQILPWKKYQRSDGFVNAKIHIFFSEGPVCIKCRHAFTEEELEKGEMGEVMKGPAKGRPRLTLNCSKCHQKNIIIKGKTSVEA